MPQQGSDLPLVQLHGHVIERELGPARALVVYLGDTHHAHPRLLPRGGAHCDVALAFDTYKFSDNNN